ncbi:hypothetical protein [Parasphingorhabdus cellanae]|uniref:Sulfotransferase family protein n=1 Tax=Parasphingorhabdus cellanae TaxID=2806553 RepID=A0ABX7T8D2_9SPHN|nr:hypothetical protein [Parasphingorhabdus cellanae]QTD56397.1 hypothetical protein J4G78_01985 [Parasphingorhabdus cellanae]
MTNSWQNQFSQDARLLPHLVDLPKDQVLLSHLTEDDYRKASFLDQRIITPQLRRQLVPWSELSKVQLPQSPTPQYIFHIGHVGSTLLSRLLGEIDTVLALREPQLLRTLCEISQIRAEPDSPWSPEDYERRFSESVRWLSRPFYPQQPVMIKASSFVSELAPELLADEIEALFLYAPLDRYIPTILAGEASVQETHMMAGARLKRLTRHLGKAPAQLWELTLAQRVAMSWMCELVTLFVAQKASHSANIMWMDFEAFLDAPQDQLIKAASHFNLELAEQKAAELVSGPIMSSYSKAPEHDYSPDLRQELLREANENHATDIRGAISWVEGIAAKFPLVAEAVQWIETRE